MVRTEVSPSTHRVHELARRSEVGASRAPVKDPRAGISDALLVVSTGIFAVTLAYVCSRAGLSMAAPLYWSGQLGLFAFVSYRVLRPGTPAREREFLVLAYAGAQSMIRWAYSPQMFTFVDELQHWRSLANLLATHHPNEANYSLPASPRYPGMENVTAELVQVSSMGSFAAGVLIAGLAHVLLAGCLLLLYRELTRSSWTACIGVLIYLLDPSAQYFTTSFSYGTVALPFVVLCIFFAIRFASDVRARYLYFLGVLICARVVAMTHHLSAFATVVLLGGLSLAVLAFRGSRHMAPRLMTCAVSSALIVAMWVYYVAPMTGDYFSDAVEQLMNGLGTFGQVEGKVALSNPLTPLVDRVFPPLAVALMLGLLLTSVWIARSLSALERTFAGLALGSYGLVLAVRLFVGNGAELSTRLLTFVSLITALAAAIVLQRIAARARAGVCTATAMAVVLLMGAITTGMPEWWERLPGTFRVAGHASGIDAVGVSRAEWAAANLQPGTRFFGDFTSITLLSTLAHLDPILAPGTLYYSDRLTPEDSALIDNQQAVYLDVDLRMAQQPPITGRYFPVDLHDGYRDKPIDREFLDKFDVLPGASRIYDSGYDRLYDLRTLQRAHYG